MSFSSAESPRMPEDPESATRRKLEAAGDDVVKNLWQEFQAALEAMQNPETRAVGFMGMLALLARLTLDDKKEKGKEDLTAPSLVPPAKDPDQKQALDHAGDDPIQMPPQTSRAPETMTGSLPYHFQNLGAGILMGGCPGYRDGKSETAFDPALARTQVEALYKQGVRTVLSLVEGEKMAGVIRDSGPPIRHERFVVHNSSESLDPRNEDLFKRVADLMSGEVPFYMHCRHGVHRAVVALAGGMMASGRARTLAEAISKAGGNLNNFLYSDGGVRAYAWPMWRQLVSFAKKRGVEVDPKYEALALSSRNPSGSARADRSDPSHHRERAG